jgi:hypothetical protein
MNRGQGLVEGDLSLGVKRSSVKANTSPRIRASLPLFSTNSDLGKEKLKRKSEWVHQHVEILRKPRSEMSGFSAPDRVEGNGIDGSEFHLVLQAKKKCFQLMLMIESSLHLTFERLANEFEPGLATLSLSYLQAHHFPRLHADHP